MSDLLTFQTAVVVLLAGLAVVASFRDIRGFAFAWAFVFPIDVVTGVPGWVFDGLRYAGAAWIVIRVRPDLPEGSRPLLRILAALLLALAAVRGAMAVVNHDNPNVRFGLVLALGTVLAYLVILRTTVHRAVIAGYLGGIAFSAAVSLLQSRGWTGIAPANLEGNRYPGLSTYNAVFSWHVATGFIVGCYLVAANARTRNRTFRLAATVTPLYALGLLTNGAQGGLLGVIAAAVAVTWAGRHRITRALLARAALAAAGLVVLVGLAVGVAGVDIPSLNDYDRSFHNEKTRVESWQRGLEEMLNHPVTGLSSREYLYDRRYRIVPHFLPLESGAMAGVLGFLVAGALVGYLCWLLFRGPADRRGQTIAAYGVLASLLINTLTEPQGPFQGVARAVPLFLIVLYASVGRPGTPAGATPGPRAAPDRADPGPTSPKPADLDRFSPGG
jgi:hypothetical protein